MVFNTINEFWLRVVAPSHPQARWLRKSFGGGEITVFIGTLNILKGVYLFVI